METGSDKSPSADEARETLQQLGQDENTVRYPPLPPWFFLAGAAIVAGLHLARLLPSSAASKLTPALGAVAILLASRHWLRRDGVSWTSAKLADMVPFLVAVLGPFVLCLVISSTTGAWWVWILGAAVAAGIVVRTGHTYRQAFGG